MWGSTTVHLIKKQRSCDNPSVSSRYRIQYESLVQVEKEQNEFIEDFGVK